MNPDLEIKVMTTACSLSVDSSLIVTFSSFLQRNNINKHKHNNLYVLKIEEKYSVQHAE